MLVFSITAILCGGLFLIFGAASAAGICAAAASVLVFFIIKRKRFGKCIIIPAVCCFALVTAAFLLIFNEAQLKKAERYEGENCTVYARVENITESGYGTEYTLRTIKINNSPVRIKISLTESDSRKFELYDCIALDGAALEKALKSDYSPDGTYYSEGCFLRAFSGKTRFVYQCSRTPVYYCLKFKEACIGKIGLYLNEHREGGILCGMIFGDKSALDTDIKNSFNRSGISHLLAVSGLHTSLWCGLLLAILSLFNAGEKLKAAVCAAFLAAFCIISGFTPSVLRASFMTVCSLCAPLFLRRADSMNSLGLAATLIVLKNPYIITSPGFVLSVSATVGVIFTDYFKKTFFTVLGKIRSRALSKLIHFVVDSLTVSLAAGIFTLPASAVFFGIFGIVSPLANLAAVQPAFFAMIIGTSALAASFLPFAAAKEAARLLFGLSKIILKYLITAARLFSGLKYSALPADKTAILTGTAIIAALSAAAYFIIKHKKIRAAFPAVCILNALTLVLSVLLPLTTAFSPCRLTVLPSQTGVAVTLADGTHFALFGSTLSVTDISSFLPLTGIQTLDLFAAPEATADCAETVDIIRKAYAPRETVIFSAVEAVLRDSGKAIPANSQPPCEIPAFADKINIKIIDIQDISCAIIKSKKKSVLVLFGQGANFAAVQKALGFTPDIAVVPQALAEDYAAFCDTVIICSGKREALTQRASKLKAHCRTVYTTANGAVTLEI